MANENVTRKRNNAQRNREQWDGEASDSEITIDDEVLEDARVGRSGQWGDPTDEPVVEVSYEELLELQDELDGDDPRRGDLVDTAHTDGSTNNVHLAMDQGLVYDPPTDPPVVPSDDYQNVEIAAGFAQSIEDSPEIADLPDRVDNNDSDAEDDIRRALRYNSETMHLDDVRVYVRDGIAYVRGTVMDDDDMALVDNMIRDLDVVDDVRIELETDY